MPTFKDIRRHTDADNALLQVALAVCEEEDGNEFPDCAFDPRGLTTHGTPSFRPFSVQDENAMGSGAYTGGDETIRRGRINVASCCVALASRSELRLTPMKVLGSIVGMRIIVRLLNAGVNLGKLTNGMPVNVTTALSEAFAASGLLVCSRKRPNPKDRATLYDGAVPADPTAERWVNGLVLWKEIGSQFHGWLGSDPATGRERTKTEVCAFFVDIAKKSATAKAEETAKRAENAADAAAEAAEALATVDSESEVEAATEEPEATAEVPEGKVDKVARFDESDWATLSESMVEQGLDPDDPKDIAQFVVACWVVASSDDEVESAKETRAS